jgi:hypothetical protein
MPVFTYWPGLRPFPLLIGLCVVGCASSPHTPRALPEPEPVPWPKAVHSEQSGGGPGPESSSVNIPAAQWLQQGFTLLQHEQFAQGVAALHTAIATQELNDAGRALAYWHIFGAEQNLGHVAAAHNALADFVVVASDLMAQAYGAKEMEGAERTFIDQFDLPGRLARSRATLSLAWAARAPSYGRTVKTPVSVHSETEMRYFIDLAPPCAQAIDRKISQRPLHINASGHPISQVTLHCAKMAQPIDYFFEVVLPKIEREPSGQAWASDQDDPARP